MLLVRPSEGNPGKMELRWDLLPSFISVQGDLHILLAQGLNKEFAGTLTTSEKDLHTVHCFICEWLQERFPMYDGLGDWLLELQRVQEE